MATVGMVFRIEWNNHYTEPPNGWPRLLAEIYFPKEDYNILQGKIPEQIASIPHPLGSGYSIHIQAINTPLKPRSKETLVMTRKKILKERMTRKYPLFAESFIAQAIAHNPKYYIEGLGACQAKREALLIWEKMEFEKYTSRPLQLVIYASPFSP
jgi:hypothetical protein